MTAEKAMVNNQIGILVNDRSKTNVRVKVVFLHSNFCEASEMYVLVHILSNPSFKFSFPSISFRMFEMKNIF